MFYVIITLCDAAQYSYSDAICKLLQLDPIVALKLVCVRHYVASVDHEGHSLHKLCPLVSHTL
jgi:hypothetical protein